MILTIVTINWNNASGLKKTMQSVLDQSFKDFEYVVVDGASTDGSVDVIKEFLPAFGDRLRWISEPDAGIYNAMNKGIRMASGDYIQILNSGDTLFSITVLEQMYHSIQERSFPNIIYGNMMKEFADGRELLDKCFAGEQITLLGMYSGTLNHDPAFIKRSLFEKYGLYDENLKICSDWEWYFYAIILGQEKPVYIDTTVTRFDMSGISEQPDQRNTIFREKRLVLEKSILEPILSDYDKYASDIYAMRRIHRHKFANKIVWFIERVLFKIEKAKNYYVQHWG